MPVGFSISDMLRPTGNRGFTLLEVLVVVTMLGIVVGAAFTNFGAGLRGYKKGVSRGEIMQEARGGLRLIDLDIETMLPVREEGVNFTAKAFSFITVRASSQENRHEKITYSFSDGSLKREVLALNKEGKPNAVEVTRGIKSGGFEYFTEGQWATEMEAEKAKTNFPEAMRIRIKLELDGEEEEVMTSFMLPVSREIKTEKKKEE